MADKCRIFDTHQTTRGAVGATRHRPHRISIADWAAIISRQASDIASARNCAGGIGAADAGITAIRRAD